MKPNRTRLKTQFAVRHARSIRLGIKDMFSIEDILDSWYSLHHPDAEQQTDVPASATRDWAKVYINRIDTSRLNLALARLYADAYTLGEDVTTYELARAVGLRKAPSRDQLSNALKIDWDNWKPGNRAAANLVKPPYALRRLLDSRGITIQGINNTTLNRIGTRLADGLNAGVSRQEMAKLINEVLDDSERSLVIAGTEMSAAVVQASKDLYADSGVEQIEWLASNPCDECQTNANQSPIGINEQWINGDPPVHPNCFCDIAPYIVDTQLLSEDN